MFTVTVEGHEVISSEPSSPHVCYMLRVSMHGSGRSWVVYRRYSKFLELETDLTREFIAFKSAIDADPTASLRSHTIARWFSDGMDISVIRDRREKIKVFFALLMNLPESVWSSDLVCDFLRIPIETPSNVWLTGEDMMSSSSDIAASTPELMLRGSPTTPGGDDDWSLLEWIESNIETDCMRVLDVLVRRKPKVSWATQKFSDRVLPLILKQISTDVSSVSSVCYLCYLEDLVSVEKNPAENQAVIHGLRGIGDWEAVRLNMHIRHPTVNSNRLRTFRIVRAVGISPHAMLGEDHVAISQYLGWYAREKTFSQLTVPSAVSMVYHPELPPMGPASPMAAGSSLGSPMTGMSTVVAATVASEARDWLLMNLGIWAENREHNRGFRLEGSVGSSLRENGNSGWTLVVPGTQNNFFGKINIYFRAGGLEVKIEWQFPMGVNMERVINLVWDGGHHQTNYFGCLDSNSMGPVSPNPVAPGPLVQSTQLTFRDQRRPGGVAICNAIKTMAKGLRDSSVIIALTSDPKPVNLVGEKNISQDPCVRIIRSLHIIGCEIDISAGSLTGLATLTPESLFLVAGDLLGERLMLWKALEEASRVLREDQEQIHKPTQTPIASQASAWLTMDKKKKILGFLNRALGPQRTSIPTAEASIPDAIKPNSQVGKYSLRDFRRDDSMEDRSAENNVVLKKNNAKQKLKFSKSSETFTPKSGHIKTFPLRKSQLKHLTNEQDPLTDEDLTRIDTNSFDWDSVKTDFKKKQNR